MYELNQVGENSYYIQSPVKIGLVRVGDREVCLIDSGSDKDAGRKGRQMVGQKGRGKKCGPYRREPVSSGADGVSDICAGDRV